MNPENPTIEQLKTMLALLEDRAKVQRQLETIDARISALQSQVFGGSGVRGSRVGRPPAVSKADSRGDGSRAAKKREQASGGEGNPSRRGELSGKIERALTDAGDNGLSVREIAESAGTNYKNVAVWFSTTGKKHPSIQKLGPARYRLGNQSAPRAADPAPPESAAAAAAAPAVTGEA